MQTPFGERLAEAVTRVGAPVGVGLDPHLDRLPLWLRSRYEGLQGAEWRESAAEAVWEFNQGVIDAIRGQVVSVKPQFAFYERLGSAGWRALERTCARAREAGLVVVGDGKRGDISSTATAYAQAALDPDGPLGCDALTVNPWMGLDTLEPFMELCRAHGSGIFVLLRTTNPGSAELQLHGDPPLARRIATALDRLGQDTVGSAGLSSVGVVVGAQVAEEARRLREQLPRAWFLVPGLGFQGGSVDDALAGSRPDGLGSLAVAARSVLYPSEPDALYEQDTFGWIANRASHLVTRVRGGIA